MGKYVLLVTLASATALSLYAGQFQRAQVDAQEERADRQKIVLARQIARSAYASGVSEVRRQFGMGLDRCEQYEGGTFELTTSPFSGDSVQVRAVGRQGTDGCECTDCPRYTIRSTAVLEQNGSFSALTFDGALESANLSGGGRGPVVSGKDAAGEQDRNGVSLSESGDKKTMREEFCKRSGSDVQGIGGTCDVIHDPEIDLEPLDEEVSDLADEQSTHEGEDLCGAGRGRGRGRGGGGKGGSVGSPENPAVIEIEENCKLSGNSGGTGILYVDGGSLTMTGNSEWEGMILVTDEGEFKASKGTPRVEGNVAFYEGGALDMRGTASIQYNSERIRELQEAFDIRSLKQLVEASVREEVRMTNRSQGITSQGSRAGSQGNAP